MIKKLTIALALLLLVIGIALWRAPARLASTALSNASMGNSGGGEIKLLAPRGTLWNGSGQLLINGELIGDVSWQVQVGRLLALEAAAAWQVRSPGYSLAGVAAIGQGNRINLRNLSGTVRQTFLRSALARYDIVPAGDLTIDHLNITNLQLNDAGNWPREIHAEGSAQWTGGPVSYRLSGQNSHIELPAMAAQVSTPDGGWPLLEVTEQLTGALLMTGRLTPTGSAAIGITRGLTRLTGQPWPGSEPDHAVVLEVEEQLI